MQSYGARLTELATAHPADDALHVLGVDGSDTVLTWGELDRRSNRWGRALREAGVGVGGRVAIEVPNSVELVLAVLGSWKVGGVPVPMRWDLPEWERTRVVAVIDPAVVIGPSTIAAFTESAASCSDAPLPDAVSPQQSGICSSGSTGTPKVILTDRPAVWDAVLATPFFTVWSPTPQPQTILVPGPMYHTNGFTTIISLLGGDRLIVLEKFDATAVLDAIESHRVSTFTATPTMLQRIAHVDDVRERDLSSIVWILQGAAVMPQTLLRTWFELLAPEKVLMAYGMSENLGLTALSGTEWLDHPGSIGRGFRGTEIAILDDAGARLPAGEVGDIYLRSPASGGYRYLGGAPLLPSTADGYGTAGDIGWLDDDGYLYIADRRVDMIVTGGANVFPAEVESALSDHPSVADVVVLGLADPEWGRRVHAVVAARDPSNPPPAADLLAFAKSRLAGYKVPKTVEFVDAIPRTAATKVSRSEMTKARDS